MTLPAGEFFTRQITHLCAPTFVFLAGTALALSIERRVLKGLDAWSIDKVLWASGAASLLAFAFVRGLNGYGNMFLLRADGSWHRDSIFKYL